jgi:DNA (cytosine-5)-methyltransferase 1
VTNLTAVSLFAGIGGFDIALEKNNIEVKAAVEIEKKSREVLAKRFPKTKLFGDVKEVSGEQLRSAGFIPERGIITGGFPCQDLSIAGLRKGLEGERSGLFYEIIRLTDELRPKFILLENVPGLLSSQQGRDMGIVITALVERGYGICWRVLDSQNFGVAQRRKRIFIIASLRDHRRPVQILFESEGSERNFKTVGEEGEKTTGRSEISSRTFVKTKRAQTAEDDEKWVEKGIVPTLNAFDLGDTRTTTIIQQPILFEGNRVDDLRIHQEGISPTLVSRWGTGGNNVPFLQDKFVRRLTPVECERLQGFPDNWTEGQADSTRYKQLGNAVTVPVVDWIIKRLVESL